MKADVRTLDNEVVDTVDLPEDIFGLSVREDILARVVNWQLARRRAGTHSTLSTGDVRGTSAKFGRQKGGGRARHGSRKTNIFRGGAVIHGPKPRSHAFKLPKRIRKLGLKMALSSKAESGQLLVLRDADLPEPKTRELARRMSGLNVGNALLIDGAAVAPAFQVAASNLPDVAALPGIGANVHDILRRETLIVTLAGLAALQERLG